MNGKLKLTVFLLACLSKAFAQKNEELIFSREVYSYKNDTLAKELFYADTMRVPFKIAVYLACYYKERIIDKELVEVGSGTLASISDFNVVPSSNKELQKYIPTGAALINDLGFVLIKPGRWLVKTGKWKSKQDGKMRDDYNGFNGPPFKIEIDHIYKLEFLPKKDGVGGVRIVKASLPGNG